MNFSPTYTLESVSHPGVTVVLNRLGPKRRAVIELQVADARSRQRVASQALEKTTLELQETLGAIEGFRAAIEALPRDESGIIVGSVTPEIVAMYTPECWALSAKKGLEEEAILRIARAEIQPVFLLAAIKSISGITSEDKPYTAELLCEIGPDALFDEVAEAINENTYVTKALRENLSLPTISGAQTDGGQTSTTALTAN